MSLFQGCPLRGVPLYTRNVLNGCTVHTCMCVSMDLVKYVGEKPQHACMHPLFTFSLIITILKWLPCNQIIIVRLQMLICYYWHSMTSWLHACASIYIPAGHHRIVDKFQYMRTSCLETVDTCMHYTTGSCYHGGAFQMPTYYGTYVGL